MAKSSMEATSGDFLFIDRGCSNHMSGTRSLFKELDESRKSDVTLPNGTSTTIEGQGLVVVNGSVQHIYDV